MIRRTGFFCTAAMVCGITLAIPFHCLPQGLAVGGCMLLDGAALGLLLAAITRTQRPALIYVCLLGAAVTFWLLLASWPPDDMASGRWKETPEGVANYLSFLRAAMFALAIPYPFARFGHHGPDAHGPPAPAPGVDPEPKPL